MRCAYIGGMILEPMPADTVPRCLGVPPDHSPPHHIDTGFKRRVLVGHYRSVNSTPLHFPDHFDPSLSLPLGREQAAALPRPAGIGWPFRHHREREPERQEDGTTSCGDERDQRLPQIKTTKRE